MPSMLAEFKRLSAKAQEGYEAGFEWAWAQKEYAEPTIPPPVTPDEVEWTKGYWKGVKSYRKRVLKLET